MGGLTARSAHVVAGGGHGTTTMTLLTMALLTIALLTMALLTMALLTTALLTTALLTMPEMLSRSTRRVSAADR